MAEKHYSIGPQAQYYYHLFHKSIDVLVVGYKWDEIN